MERISQGRLITGIGGVILLISLFLNWFDVHASTSGALNQSFQFNASTAANAWKWFDFADIFMFLVALVAIAPAAFDLAGLELDLPFKLSVVSLAGGAIAVLYILFRMFIDKPGPSVNYSGAGVDFGVGLKYGAWIGLLSAIAVTVGSWRQMSEDDDFAAPAVAGRPPQAPPVQPPPPPPPAEPPPAAPPSAPPPAG